MAVFHAMRGAERLLDGRARQPTCSTPASHFYDTYETRDGRYVSIGSIEPQFYKPSCYELSGLEGEELPRTDGAASDWDDHEAAPQSTCSRTKTRDEWCEIMEGSDVCFAPVLTMAETPSHPHIAARDTFVEVAGLKQPAPAPRFSRTPPTISRPPAHAGQHTNEALTEWGFASEELRKLREAGAVR